MLRFSIFYSTPSPSPSSWHYYSLARHIRSIALENIYMTWCLGMIDLCGKYISFTCTMMSGITIYMYMYMYSWAAWCGCLHVKACKLAGKAFYHPTYCRCCNGGCLWYHNALTWLSFSFTCFTSWATTLLTISGTCALTCLVTLTPGITWATHSVGWYDMIDMI